MFAHAPVGGPRQRSCCLEYQLTRRTKERSSPSPHLLRRKRPFSCMQGIPPATCVFIRFVLGDKCKNQVSRRLASSESINGRLSSRVASSSVSRSVCELLELAVTFHGSTSLSSSRKLSWPASILDGGSWLGLEGTRADQRGRPWNE